MLYRDVISIKVVKPTTNSIGDPIDAVQSTTTFYANKKSVRQSEFYQAMAAGLKPELMFETSLLDYKALEATLEAGEDIKLLVYESTTYDIVRTYEREDEQIEIVVSKVVNKG